MALTPNLQVPQARPTGGSHGGLGIIIVLLLVILAVQLTSLARGRRAVSPGGGVTAAMLTPEQLKKAAVELESKNLPREAAAMWERYLQSASLPAAEAGNIRYLIGKDYQNAEAYPEAFTQFVQAEMLLEGAKSDVSHKISLARMDCLKRMGRYAELSRELDQRASADSSAQSLATQQIVAEIGGDKLTIADFDRMLSNQIEQAVQSRVGISQEDADALRRRAHEQFADPQMKGQQLQQLIALRVLAQEARKRGLNDQDTFRERLLSVADSLLGETLLHDEIGKRSVVTDADIRRFYDASNDRYSVPAASFIAHIQCKDEAQARDLIARIQGGESFEKLAESDSQDAATKSKEGAIAEPVAADGDMVPHLGKNAPLHTAIRDAEAGKILPDPYKSDAGWHVIKVVSHREKQDKPFEEVADAARRDATAARQRETTEAYLKELFGEYQVKLYPEVFSRSASPAATPNANSSGVAKESGHS
jgi:peptidyl-prolyl cis-trans isomerase C